MAKLYNDEPSFPEPTGPETRQTSFKAWQKDYDEGQWQGQPSNDRLPGGGNTLREGK